MVPGLSLVTVTALVVLIPTCCLTLRPVADSLVYGNGKLGVAGHSDKKGPSTEKCRTVQVRCAYRVGCGAALREYMSQCAEVIAGRTGVCKAHCKRALIALTSTDEGQILMTCDCEGSEYCELSKQRVEVCRPEVSRAVAQGSVVSCSVAEWICTADQLCVTALNYYHQYCGAMFEGRKCTLRCNNSIHILARQEKAAKLRTCKCDGSEEFPCEKIRSNTNRLCFGREKGGQIGGKVTEEDTDRAENEVVTTKGTKDEDGIRKRGKSNSNRIDLNLIGLVIGFLLTRLRTT